MHQQCSGLNLKPRFTRCRKKTRKLQTAARAKQQTTVARTCGSLLHCTTQRQVITYRKKQATYFYLVTCAQGLGGASSLVSGGR